MVAVHHLLCGDALLACTDGDRHAVLVASADEHHFLMLQSEVTHIDVGRYIDSGEVSDVHSTVGIRQGGSDGCALEFVLFHNI